LTNMVMSKMTDEGRTLISAIHADILSRIKDNSFDDEEVMELLGDIYRQGFDDGQDSMNDDFSPSNVNDYCAEIEQTNHEIEERNNAG